MAPYATACKLDAHPFEIVTVLASNSRLEAIALAKRLVRQELSALNRQHERLNLDLEPPGQGSPA